MLLCLLLWHGSFLLDAFEQVSLLAQLRNYITELLRFQHVQTLQNILAIYFLEDGDLADHHSLVPCRQIKLVDCFDAHLLFVASIDSPIHYAGESGADLPLEIDLIAVKLLLFWDRQRLLGGLQRHPEHHGVHHGMHQWHHPTVHHGHWVPPAHRMLEFSGFRLHLVLL